MLHMGQYVHSLSLSRTCGKGIEGGSGFRTTKMENRREDRGGGEVRDI